MRKYKRFFGFLFVLCPSTLLRAVSVSNGKPFEKYTPFVFKFFRTFVMKRRKFHASAPTDPKNVGLISRETLRLLCERTGDRGRRSKDKRKRYSLTEPQRPQGKMEEKHFHIRENQKFRIIT